MLLFGFTLCVVRRSHVGCQKYTKQNMQLRGGSSSYSDDSEAPIAANDQGSNINGKGRKGVLVQPKGLSSLSIDPIAASSRQRPS